MKRYTFAQLAKRNCAECTTTITTTLPERYYLASDVDRLRADAVRLRNCLRALTDGSGDGEASLIAEGRAAVIDTGYLDEAPRKEGEG